MNEKKELVPVQLWNSGPDTGEVIVLQDMSIASFDSYLSGEENAANLCKLIWHMPGDAVNAFLRLVAEAALVGGVKTDGIVSKYDAVEAAGAAIKKAAGRDE